MHTPIQTLVPVLIACSLIAGRSVAHADAPRISSTAAEATAQQLLHQYTELAVVNSPALATGRAKHAAAREMVSPAGALPDPMVGVMYQSVGAPWEPMAPMSMIQGEISQAIPGLGKRQARRNSAEAEAAMRKAETDTTRHRLAGQVRALFAQVYATDKEQQAIESAEQLIDLMVGTVTGQFTSGTIDQEALFKAELERSKLREQLNDIQATREMLVARLNTLMGRPENASVPRLDALPDIPDETPDALVERPEHAPELRMQRAAVALAGRRLELAETESHPNFLVGLAGGTTTNALPVVTLRFAMELPIWRATKLEPMVRAAQHDIEASESEYRAAALKIRGELRELALRFKRDTVQCKLYRERIIPNAAQTLQAARTAYSTGRADFATVIDDFRIWLDVQVGLARREADRLATWAELRAIRGDAH